MMNQQVNQQKTRVYSVLILVLCFILPFTLGVPVSRTSSASSISSSSTTSSSPTCLKILANNMAPMPKSVTFKNLGIVQLITSQLTFNDGFSKHFKVRNPKNPKEFIDVMVPAMYPAAELAFIREIHRYRSPVSSLQEISILRKLGRLIDTTGLEDGRAVVAAKWIPGDTLEDILKSGKVQSLKELKYYVDAVDTAYRSLLKLKILPNIVMEENIVIRKNNVQGRMLGKPYIAEFRNFRVSDYRLNRKDIAYKLITKSICIKQLYDKKLFFEMLQRKYNIKA